jgi:hypothetical protein
MMPNSFPGLQCEDEARHEEVWGAEADKTAICTNIHALL